MISFMLRRGDRTFGGRAAMAGTGLFMALLAAAVGFQAEAQKPRKQSATKNTVVPKTEISPEDREFFENKIRPMLVDQCFTCHAAANKTAMGGLQLDSREKLLKGGGRGTALVPGKPEASLLLRAVSHTDPKLQMPPNSKLTSEQIAALTEWVKRGAPWPSAAKQTAPSGFSVKARAGHWAYQPLKKAAPPVAKPAASSSKITRQTSKIENPIDAFLQVKRAAKGWKPAPPADKRTLLRRVTFDLTGLPPTPDEIAAFLSDKSPNAYEKVVERLLASPHYGERWARHWLDLTRYAETDGHEFDFEKPGAYEYRDYVIRAFNADVPYDQFVKEHIAGDLLPNPRRHPTEKFNESIIGTGFWWLGEGKHSPVDLRVDEGDRVDNQIDVFGKMFLAQTLACARCHDHKFDALSTKDYYALSGFIKSSRYQQAAINAPEAVRPVALTMAEQAKPLQKRLAQEAAKTQIQVFSHAAGEAGVKAVRLQDPPASLGVRKSGQVAGRAVKDTKDPFYALALLTGDEANRSPEAFAAKKSEALQKLREQAEKAEKAREKVTVFEDFAKPDYAGWYVSGEAFGSGPAASALRWQDAGQVVSVFGGGLADSGSVSETLQGALRSKTFLIPKNFLLFRMAGSGTQVNLIIDGFQRIRAPIYGGLTIELKAPNRMAWYAMDLTKWVGHRAYIEFLDMGPGRIIVDEIVFADAPTMPDAPNALILKTLDDPALGASEALAKSTQALIEETLNLWAGGQLETAPDSRARLELVNALLQHAAPQKEPAEAKPVSDAPTLAAAVEQFRKTEAKLPPIRRVMAAADGTGEDDRVHLRGSHKTLGEVAPRQFLEVFRLSSPATASAKEKEVTAPAWKSDCGRLELAQQLTTVSAPLLARVMVNRLWHHHFGAGLVRTTDDFGLMGDRPTHPELLDWLAAAFMAKDERGRRNAESKQKNSSLLLPPSSFGGAWSLKKMHRLMVLSQAYRMASHSDAKTEEADPQNRLLHRMNIRRLQAEEVRDAILAVSGRLDKTMFGPSVLPHLTQFMEGRGRPSSSGPLDGNGRRSLYIGVRRNFLTPFFLAFDYPVPFSTMGRRTVSNVPAQALALMNNPMVVEQATVWAKRVLSQPGSAAERIHRMYETAFGRPPTDAERADALAFLAERSKEIGAEDDPRAWADLCHVLFNLKEFIYLH